MVGVPAVKQPAYDGYINNLPAFLHATAVQSRVSVMNVWYKASIPATKIIPLALPPLTVQSKRALKTEEQKLEFVGSLGFIPEEIKGPMGVAYVCRKPTLDILRKLPTTINTNTPSTPDATSYMGINTYIFTLRVISLFLATHTYPAHQTADMNPRETSSSDADFFFGGSGILPIEKYRGVENIYANLGGSGVDMATEAGWAAVSNDMDTRVYNRISGKDAVLVAKPAPLRPEVNYGPPSTVPNMPGYVFGYFHGLIDGDKSLIIEVMSSYFLGCFGDSNEKAAEFWSEWLKGVDKWYKTKEGKIVAHILFGIRLALQSQSRLYVVMTAAGYHGFALQGHKFTIWDNGATIIPESPHRLRALCVNLDHHALAMIEICSMLSKATLKAGEVDEDLDVNMKSRKLFRELNKREQIVGEELEKLKEHIAKLAFSDILWPVDVNYITKWIKLLTVDTPIDDSTPMYIDPGSIYDTSRMHQILAAFGPTAPSLLDAAGSDYIIPKGLAAEDVASQEDPATRKIRLHSILVSSKKLSVAVLDGLNVVKKRRIRQNLIERAAGYRTIKFSGDGRNQIWNALKLLPYVVEEDKGKKRAREDDDVEEGTSKKTKEKAVELDTVDSSLFD